MPDDTITSDNLGEKILEGARTAFGARFAKVKTFVKAESEKLAVTLRMIIEARARNEITEDEARVLLNMQKVSASAVITAAEGMTAVAVQAAIDAALGVVRQFVNGKLGFNLL